MNEENIDSMECPCLCDCGNWFDLEDGYGCYTCSKTVCPDCISEDNEHCKECLKTGEIK